MYLGSVGIWHSFWIAEALTLLIALLVSFQYRARNKFLSPLFLLDTEAEVNGTYKSFSVQNTLESITVSAAGIGEFCDANDLPPKKAMAISLSIEELLVSIGKHSLENDAEQTINVRLLIYEDMVVMRIRSAGKPFNPVEYHECNEDDLDSLGIDMILKIADNVHYSATFGVNNITVII